MLQSLLSACRRTIVEQNEMRQIFNWYHVKQETE